VFICEVVNPKRRFPFDGSRFTVPAFQALLLPLAVFSGMHCDDQEVSVCIIHRLEAFERGIWYSQIWWWMIDKQVQMMSRYARVGTMVEDARRERKVYR
jgi:hypothetical protein